MSRLSHASRLAAWSAVLLVGVALFWASEFYPDAFTVRTAPATDVTGMAAADCHVGTLGTWGYRCSSACPCAAGEGDCNADEDCEQGLACNQNRGSSYGFDAGMDICEARGTAEPPGTGGQSPNGTQTPSTPSAGGCHKGQPGSWSYVCSPACPCSAGEGDCDSDADCADQLVCLDGGGRRYGWEKGFDTCELSDGDSEEKENGTTQAKTTPKTLGSYGYCSKERKCNEGEGPCGSNGDCATGVCLEDVGKLFGVEAGKNFCVPAGFEFAGRPLISTGTSFVLDSPSYAGGSKDPCQNYCTGSGYMEGVCWPQPICPAQSIQPQGTSGLCTTGRCCCKQSDPPTAVTCRCQTSSGYTCYKQNGEPERSWMCMPGYTCQNGKVPLCQGSGTSTSGREINCNDGADNDNDGATDCADTDCSNNMACQKCTPGWTCSKDGKNREYRNADCSGVVQSCGSGTCVNGQCQMGSQSTSCTDMQTCQGNNVVHQNRDCTTTLVKACTAGQTCIGGACTNTGGSGTSCQDSYYCQGNVVIRRRSDCTTVVFQTCPSGQTCMGGLCIVPRSGSGSGSSSSSSCNPPCVLGMTCMGGLCVVQRSGSSCQDSWYCWGNMVMHRLSNCQENIAQTCSSGQSCIGGACRASSSGSSSSCNPPCTFGYTCMGGLCIIQRSSSGSSSSCNPPCTFGYTCMGGLCIVPKSSGSSGSGSSGGGCSGGTCS